MFAAHPYASKFAAGFRQIQVIPAAQMLQVVFIGAPPQYCFEQYEVRLLDESGMELLYSGIVSINEMRAEKINGAPVLYGQFNFSQLEVQHFVIANFHANISLNHLIAVWEMVYPISDPRGAVV